MAPSWRRFAPALVEYNVEYDTLKKIFSTVISPIQFWHIHVVACSFSLYFLVSMLASTC